MHVNNIELNLRGPISMLKLKRNLIITGVPFKNHCWHCKLISFCVCNNNCEQIDTHNTSMIHLKM
jgi:hypothetical protein